MQYKDICLSLEDKESKKQTWGIQIRRRRGSNPKSWSLKSRSNARDLNSSLHLKTEEDRRHRKGVGPPYANVTETKLVTTSRIRILEDDGKKIQEVARTINEITALKTIKDDTGNKTPDVEDTDYHVFNLLSSSIIPFLLINFQFTASKTN